MKTKRIIALCLFLLAAFSGLCLARSDTQFYYTEEYVWWADGATIDHIDGAVYQIYTSAESPNDPAYRTVIVARVDMEGYAYSRQQMFAWDGPQRVDLPLEDAGEWHPIQPGSMEDALYDFLYERLHRKGKL